jgi:hypothetical protein
MMIILFFDLLSHAREAPVAEKSSNSQLQSLVPHLQAGTLCLFLLSLLSKFLKVHLLEILGVHVCACKRRRLSHAKNLTCRRIMDRKNRILLLV